MWTCPNCNQHFKRQNQSHSCNDRTIESFLAGKSVQTQTLYHYFNSEFLKLGHFELHPAKSRIAFASKIRFGYFHRLGKDYIDVVLHFRQCYEDNFCFHKISGLPGGAFYNHYIRIYNKEDINTEVKKYLQMALENGNEGIFRH